MAAVLSRKTEDLSQAREDTRLYTLTEPECNFVVEAAVLSRKSEDLPQAREDTRLYTLTELECNFALEAAVLSRGARSAQGAANVQPAGIVGPNAASMATLLFM